MKKLLIFMLVLGLTASVQADLLPIQLSVNGVYDGYGNVTEISVVPCTYIEIDVNAPAGLDYSAYLIIDGVFPGSAGEWGDGLGPPYQGLSAGQYYKDANYPQMDAGAGVDSTIARYTEEGWGFGYEFSDTLFSGTNPGGTAFVFMFHCAKVGDVTISLYNAGGDYETPDDQILVHQEAIPEPATIALLGLGGLLLRRRK